MEVLLKRLSLFALPALAALSAGATKPAPPQGRESVSARVWLKEQHFGTPGLKPGRAAIAPGGGAWKLEDGAGVVNAAYAKNPAFTPARIEKTGRSDGRAVGFRFTTGDRPVYLYQLGRCALPGDRPGTVVALYRSDGSPLGEGLRPGAVFGDDAPSGSWRFLHTGNSKTGMGKGGDPAVYCLAPHTGYLILTTENKGSPLPAPVKVTPAAGIRIDEAVYADTAALDPGRAVGAGITRAGPAGTAFPHISFTFSTGIMLPGGHRLAPPDPSDDTDLCRTNAAAVSAAGQMLFIAGQGKASQELTITDAGEYFVELTGAGQHDADNTLRITIGDRVAWSRPGPGAGRGPSNVYTTRVTECVTLEPGTYTLTIEGLSGRRSDVAYINTVRIDTVDTAAAASSL